MYTNKYKVEQSGRKKEQPGGVQTNGIMMLYMYVPGLHTCTCMCKSILI